MPNYKEMRDVVQDMIDAGAPDEEIESYIRKQGVSTQEAKRNFAMLPPGKVRANPGLPDSAEPPGLPSFDNGDPIKAAQRNGGKAKSMTPRPVMGLQPSGVTLPTMEQSMREETNARGPMDRLLAGIGGAADKAAYGLKQAFTPLDPAEQERMKLNKIANNNPAGLAGNIIGDVAMVAPASKAVSMLAQARKAPALAELAGQTGLGAGYGALATPGDRGGGALAGGAGGLLGTSVGMALGGALKPAAGSVGEKYIAQGIELSPGQANGGVTRWLENRLRGMAPNVARSQSQGLEDWSRRTLESALPQTRTQTIGGETIKAAPKLGKGRNAINEAAQQWDEAFDGVYAKMGNVVPDADLARNLATVYQETAPAVTPEASKELLGNIIRLRGVFQNGSLNGRAIADEMRDYQTLATKANSSGNGRLGKAYQAIADNLEDLVRKQYPDLAKELGALKNGYADFLRIQTAAGRQGAEEGVFTPKQLLSAIRQGDRSSGKRAFARGNARRELLAHADEANRVFGSDIPQVGPGTAEKLVIPLATHNSHAMIPATVAQILYSQPLQRFAMGQYPWQKYLMPYQTGIAGISGGLNSNKRR